MVMPKIAKHLGMKTSHSGTWLIDLLDGLSSKKDMEIAVMTYYAGSEYKDITLGGVRYFLFPGGGKRLLHNNPKTRRDCQKVLDEFKPDLIHIHGTEYAPGYEMLNTGTKIPTLLTIQGILKRISEELNGGLTKKELRQTTSFRSLLKFKTPFTIKLLYKKNANRERKVIEKVKYATGRTDWDKSTMLSINPNLKYFRCNYNLRDEFYAAEKWDINKISRQTILTGACGSSFKGLHVLLKALSIVKQQYPKVKLYVPGGKAVDGKLVNPKGYNKLINNLIAELDLKDNVYFLGAITSAEVVRQMQIANVLVVPSSMEGASATVREAMMIGTPSICSYRGGMTELITDYVNGFTYDFIEHPMLAHRIIEIFENDDLAVKFSKKSIELAEIRHDRTKNIDDMADVYNYIVKNQ